MQTAGWIFLLSALPLFAATLAYAEEPPARSLFFTNEESAQISALQAKETAGRSDDGDIHLEAIMYYGPGDWTLWLQGMRWTPQTDRPDIHVVDVQSDQVRLRIAGVADDVVLKPHQTFQVATGKIIEGN